MDNQSIELEAKQAKQRASVKWILSKAFNNRVPENLKEPFYRDHEGQEHLKPQIVVDLGNATLYCQTLSNLYSDPNYQSLNHWSILQTLSRKGVPLNEANNVQLTETVLIQTNPLRVNAHMSVIEALMVLYAKEVATLDRISAVIGRVSGGLLPSSIQGHENALLYWVSHACAALKRRIDQEIELGAIDEDGARRQSPYVPPVRDYKDLCDGVCIAFLISYYCPKVVPWTLVRVNHLPSVEDSIHNILLVLNFSQKHLPYSVFHMTPEDISYMRGSMRNNLIVLLADLFNLFEIHPAKCVSYPGSEQIPVARSPSATQLRRPTPPKDTFVLHQEMGMQQQQLQQDDNNGFVVHKSRGVPTLSSMHQQQQQQEPLIPARLRLAKEKTNVDSKADERGDTTIAAGRPSDWGEQRRPSFAGRRSRRNSLTDDSQLTIENFGGSQDHLNLVGRLEKERERKISSASMGEPAVAIRSSAQDARGTLQIGYEMDTETEKQDRETEKIAMKRQASVENVSLRNMEDLNKNKKTTSFATLPNTTTWQQQSLHHQQAENNSELYSTEDTRPLADASKLSTVRMKLEEKRRLIEQEKRKLELAMSRQQQKVGQAAFLQAINKDITSDMNNVESKWAATHIETKKTPDLDQMDLEQYQYGSQQNLSSVGGGMGGPGGMMYHHRSPMQQQQHHHQMMSYGSTPQLAQSNFGGGNNMGFVMRSAPLNRDFAQNQFVDEQGRYVNQNNSSFNREGSPYSGHQNNYNQQQMMNNGNCDNGQMYDNYGQNMGGNEYMQPQQLHKNYLSRERLNQGNNPPYYGDGGNNGNYSNQMQSNQFYLHDQNVAHHQSPPVPPQRRTWAQSAAQNPLPLDIAAWSQNSPKSTSLNNSAGGGFKLHQNGGDNDNSYRTNSHNNSVSNLFPVHSSSPQHSRVHRQISQMIDDSNRSLDQQQQHQHQQQQSSRNLDNRMPKSPPADEMAPQSISFIGDEDSVDLSSTPLKMSNVFNRQNSGKNSNLEESLGKLNISSGSRTYRIPSPTRPLLNAKSFQDPNAEDPNTGKGFYISFDSEAPKRPKPPLRTKRSPKKEQSLDKSSDLNQHNELDNSDRFATTTRKSVVDHNNHENSMRFQGEPVPAKRHHITDTGSERMTHYSYDQQQTSQQIQQRKHLEDVTNYEPQIMHNVNYNNNESRTNDSPDCKALLIGNNLDPSSVDEMEKKKEKIMLMSLQRRQQQEEAKARKEIEAMQRREREQMKEDEKMRKKEEQAARRQAILEAHKLKKAIDEAEREGKVIDKADLMLLKQQQQALQIHPAAVRRPQKTTRPRPKTIHVESGSVDISEASSLGSSRGKKGSNSNLTGMGRTLSSTSMRRDYYRGSQDSLIRDTDSGLGRATPPRRAPSPGMGGGGGSQAIGRHLPSPSGPGSLPPGLMNKRRIFDDGSSDISSNQSSMMDYNGPKLYKQPAAKSNRGIILNAVEYCVFPGVVNRDAKQKVLEKIARSEAKHFLILFRDAGCQFRALYGYYPETEQVSKLFGTGPSQVDEYMFDKFFKYNSGGKCFSQIHTKHLTVTIDAFTIHNSLWQGKKVNLPSKKDMTLVI